MGPTRCKCERQVRAVEWTNMTRTCKSTDKMAYGDALFAIIFLHEDEEEEEIDVINLQEKLNMCGFVDYRVFMG